MIWKEMDQNASEIYGKELKTMAGLEEIVENSDGYSLHYIKVVND